MSTNLSETLRQLKNVKSPNRCSVCAHVAKMDADTRDAFIDVMTSSVTVKAIGDALLTEGIQLSRFQLGEARRECIKGSKDCPTFKGESK